MPLVGNKNGITKFEMHMTGSHVAEDGTEEMRVVTLDKALRGERVTFIKMDIEGCELAALQGAAEIIRTQRPKLAICVYHKRMKIFGKFQSIFGS